MKNRKEYFKKYYQKNKEKIIKKSKEYYQENKDSIKEYNKKYNQDNVEKIQKKAMEYREEHREYNREKAKEYYQENKELIKAKRRIRYAKNKDKELLKQKTHKMNKKLDKNEIKIVAEYNSLHKDEIKDLKAQWRKEKEKLFQTIYYYEKTKPKRKEIQERNKNVKD